MVDIKLLLIDADGVIQSFDEAWMAGLKRLVDKEKSDEFLADVFASEKPTLVGDVDFAEAAETLLDRWCIDEPTEDFLRRWNAIDVHSDILKLVSDVRASGFLVCLASNQHFDRASYMRKILEYENQFDHLFFSCELGAVKPEPQFFDAVFNRLASNYHLEPRNVLFIDDSKNNVESAIGIGLHAETFDAKLGAGRLKTIIDSYMTVNWSLK